LIREPNRRLNFQAAVFGLGGEENVLFAPDIEL